MPHDKTPVLPALADQRRLREELGVSEATADAIFRAVPVIRFPGHRRAFVRVDDVLALLAEGATDPEPLLRVSRL
jgi:nucleoside-diphosphate-sugar epimerase